MKISNFLPILAAAGNKRQKMKKDEKSVDRINYSAITEECTNQVPSLDGTFETTNNGFSGEINLDNYPNNALCKHVIQAHSRCSEIKIQYRSVGVEPNAKCIYDSFHFGRNSGNGFEVTEPACKCFGDGCQTSGVYLWDDYDLTNYFQDFDQNSDYVFDLETFVVDSNTFTFYFKSDGSLSGGHVIIEWECPEGPTTTTTTTTTTTM